MKRIFVALALLGAVALAGQAQAADAPGYGLTIGGKVQADMGWQFLADNQLSNNSDGTISNFFATLNSESYLRAMFTSADKTTGAHIELGMSDGTNYENGSGDSADGPFGSENAVYLRYAYGWWNVGSCKLLVGQMDGRLGDSGAMQALGVDKSGKGGLAGFGFIGATRNPKVAWQMEVNENVSFEVAIGQAGAEIPSIADMDPALRDVSATNSYLPRLEAVVDFTFGEFTFGLGGGISYQSYKISDGSALPPASNSDFDDSTLSYVLWLPVEYTHGPFTVVLSLHYGQNVDTDWTGENTTEFDGSIPGRSINAIYGGQPGSLPHYNGTDIENTNQWGVGVDFNYALTEQLTLGVGGGVTHLANDAWDVPGGKDNYTRWAAYVALNYQITDNFSIQPEVGYYNYGDLVGQDLTGLDKDNAGDEWLAGVQFQFLF